MIFQADKLNSKRYLLIVFVVMLAFKICAAVYFSNLATCKNPELSAGLLAKTGGDTTSYLDPIENYLSQGTYYFWNGERQVFAGRMPYYGALYLPFRLLFSPAAAKDCLVLLQIFCDALATILFAALCFRVLKNPFAFWCGLLLYALSFNYFLAALELLPECLSLNLTIFFLYFFHIYWEEGKTAALWAANVSLTGVFLLKPVFAPIYAFFLIVYFYRESQFDISKIKTTLLRGTLLTLPILILLSPWVSRNLINHNQLVFTQENMLAGYYYSSSDLAFRRLMAVWGGDATTWDSTSSACYFVLNPPSGCTYKLSSYNLTEGYSLEELESARADYLSLQRQYSPELNQTTTEKFERLITIYKSERPFMYYFGSGLMRIKTMVWHTSNSSMPIYFASPCYQTYQLVFKVIQFAIYVMALTLGLIGVIWLTVKKRISLIFPFIPLFLITFFPFFNRHVEYRFFNQAYPVFLLGLVAFLFLIYSKINFALLSRRWSKNS